jgi:hypothetical protein
LTFFLEEPLRILTVSCHAYSAASTGSDIMALSTPIRMSPMESITQSHGVTGQNNKYLNVAVVLFTEHINYKILTSE